MKPTQKESNSDRMFRALQATVNGLPRAIRQRAILPTLTECQVRAQLEPLLIGTGRSLLRIETSAEGRNAAVVLGADATRASARKPSPNHPPTPLLPRSASPTQVFEERIELPFPVVPATRHTEAASPQVPAKCALQKSSGAALRHKQKGTP